MASTDDNGNYPDEIDYDGPPPSGDTTLGHWILKCHRKNQEIDSLREWQEYARDVIRAFLVLTMADSPTGEGAICQVCKAHLPIHPHKDGCATSIGVLLLDPYTILANLRATQEAAEGEVNNDGR